MKTVKAAVLASLWRGGFSHHSVPDVHGRYGVEGASKRGLDQFNGLYLAEFQF